MNEQIRLLADQAELTIRTSTGTYMSHPEFNKKFAELIVQECLSKIENDRFELPDFIINSVKQHFGVKE